MQENKYIIVTDPDYHFYIVMKPAHTFASYLYKYQHLSHNNILQRVILTHESTPMPMSMPNFHCQCHCRNLALCAK